MSQHLKKFAFRDFNELTKPKPNRKLGVEVPKPSGNEFLSIVTSCKKYADDNNDNEPEMIQQKPLRVRKLESEETRIPNEKPQENDSYMLDGRKEFSSKSITFSELQKKSPEIKAQLQKNMSDVNKDYPKLKTKENFENPENTDVVALNKNDKDIIESLKFRENIRIPKKLWKKGKIYQVDDCFYADDGEFLYRVPGLRN